MAADSRDLFTSAAPYYARYRAGYPAELVAWVVQAAGLDGTGSVIDIGCGTGQFAIPIAAQARAVVALDPVVEMLEGGRRAAVRAGIDNIIWRLGDSTELSEIVEPGTRLASFAASFHWTDRLATLVTLDRLLGPDGCVAVINNDLKDDEMADWDQAITELRSHYVGLDAAPGAITEQPVSHRDVLSASPFSRLVSTTCSWTRSLTIDEVIGLQLSYSFSSPAKLGARLDAFCADIRATVLALYPGGVVTETLSVEGIVATRPESLQLT